MGRRVDVEHLAGLKSYLERRLNDLEKKVALYRDYISAIDTVLTQASFKVAADLLKEGEAKVTESEAVKGTVTPRTIELISRADGTDLGKIVVSPKSIKITPAQDIKCPVDSGTFSTFFVKRILNNMIQKDEELIKLKKIQEKEKMAYTITKNKDDTLKEITISNYRDESRIDDITNTIRWTLEKTL